MPDPGHAVRLQDCKVSTFGRALHRLDQVQAAWRAATRHWWQFAKVAMSRGFTSRAQGHVVTMLGQLADKCDFSVLSGPGVLTVGQPESVAQQRTGCQRRLALRARSRWRLYYPLKWRLYYPLRWRLYYPPGARGSARLPRHSSAAAVAAVQGPLRSCWFLITPSVRPS